jgi:hypothetical protein
MRSVTVTVTSSGDKESMPRQLFIVARRDRELYEYLKRRFDGRSDVEVIFDRRVDQRRSRSVAPDRERRGRDRRSRSLIDEDLETLGFAILPVP